MNLKLIDFHNIVQELAPLNFAEDYDNVGLMVGDYETEVTSILVSLDCTLSVIDEASKKDCNLIFTHHPLIFHKISSVTSSTLSGEKIIKLINKNINVYSAHTNLDSVSNGINDILMKMLGFITYENIISGHNTSSCNGLNNGIGRIAKLEEPVTLDELCKKVKDSLGISCLRYCGNDLMKIKKVAVINGSGQDYIREAKAAGADCIITGDTTYHYASDLIEENVALIDAEHFYTEWPAFKIFASQLQNKIEYSGFDNKIILSSSVKSPYMYK